MEKTEILYGLHSVTEALKAGKRELFEIYMLGEKESKNLDPIVHLAQKKGIPIIHQTQDKLKSLSQTARHQNIAAKVDPYPYSEFVCQSRTDRDGHSLYLMLDHVLDPQNLGAILRTALCAGIHQVIIPKDRSAGATPAVSRASAGALEHIHLSRVTNLVNTIKALKQAGVWVMGLDRDAKDMIYSMDLTVPLCVVIGGEDLGIRPLVRKWCDGFISIPQVGKFNSLNASVAAAVVLYEAVRQRAFSKG